MGIHGPFCIFWANLTPVSLSGPGWTLSNANGSISVPASVPGDAHAALAAAGIIADIYYRFNDLKLSWVANDSWAWGRELPALPGSAGSGKWVPGLLTQGDPGATC
jgi:hypothetical protein